MSAVLHLYATRENGSTTLAIDTADGRLVITWPYKVDSHEIAKAERAVDPGMSWAAVLDRVSNTIDCAGARVLRPKGHEHETNCFLETH